MSLTSVTSASSDDDSEKSTASATRCASKWSAPTWSNASSTSRLSGKTLPLRPEPQNHCSHKRKKTQKAERNNGNDPEKAPEDSERPAKQSETDATKDGSQNGSQDGSQERFARTIRRERKERPSQRRCKLATVTRYFLREHRSRRKPFPHPTPFFGFNTSCF